MAGVMSTSRYVFLLEVLIETPLTMLLPRLGSMLPLMVFSVHAPVTRSTSKVPDVVTALTKIFKVALDRPEPVRPGGRPERSKRMKPVAPPVCTNTLPEVP
jgi:hypothetical protein